MQFLRSKKIPVQANIQTGKPLHTLILLLQHRGVTNSTGKAPPLTSTE